MSAPSLPALTAADLGFGADRDGWRKTLAGHPVAFRCLRTVPELLPVEAIQREVFGVEDRDLAAASALVVVPETGGETIAAFVAGEPDPAGVVVGWGGYVDGRPRLVSDMLLVRPARRGMGIGAALKTLQAAVALERGYAEIVWTVDPLRAANARLNFEKLGARAARYEEDRYGAGYGAGLYGGMPTDRLHVTWSLADPAVRERLLAAIRPRTPADVAGLAPWRPDFPTETRAALVSLPSDIDRLLAADPAAALRWRLALRETLQAAFAAGWAITGFVAGAEPTDEARYVMERGTGRERTEDRDGWRSTSGSEPVDDQGKATPPNATPRPSVSVLSPRSSVLSIASIEIVPVRLPLREPFAIAYATYPDVRTVLVRLVAADGTAGWGEATPDPNVTGETVEATVAVLRHDLAPALLGRDARDRAAIHRALDARVEGVPAAKAALDIALHDLIGRATGVPVWALLGGRTKDGLTISRVVSMKPPEEMAADAAAHVAAGFRTVKVKVGGEADPALDGRRLAAVREAVGPDIGIKVDANQGWRVPGVAIAATRALLPSRPEYVEQPVAWWDLEGLAEVRRQTGAEIMVDEGVHGPREMARVVALRAADLVNIKLMKCGGLLPALALNAIAETAGIAAQVGTMVESSIASAAGLHLALALDNVRTVEMGGPLMLSSDIGDAASWYAGDRITVPDHPGLGITVDEEAVARFAEARYTL